MTRDIHRITTAERKLHDQTNILPLAQLLVVFATLSVALFISFVEQNGISITLPTIAADLGAADTVSWAGTSSLVANTTFQMLYGRLSDIFGRKNVLLSAIGLLALADLLCGLARSPAMFYVFRGVAGIGGGGISNLSMIIVSDVVILQERGKYQGIIGAFVGLGNVCGPFLAAAFVENVTWRGFFYMLAPLCVVVGVISYLILPDRPPTVSLSQSARRIDYLGTLTSSLGVISLLIPISGGGAYFPWRSSLVISLLVIGSLLLISFVLVEYKIAKLPMMPLDMFRNTAVTTILVQSFLFGAVYQSYLYFIPLYLQNARGFDVMASAGIFCIISACQSVLSILTGQYIARKQRYGEVIWLGFAIWTLGAGCTLTYTRISSIGAIMGPLILIGSGVGCIFQPTLTALQAHSPLARRAVIISNRNFFRCAGGAVGLAVSSAVLQATLRASLPKGFGYLADSTYVLPKDLAASAEDRERVLDAYMRASRNVFILQVPLVALCLIGCVLVQDRGLHPVDDAVSVPNEKDTEESLGDDSEDIMEGERVQKTHEFTRDSPGGESGAPPARSARDTAD